MVQCVVKNERMSEPELEGTTRIYARPVCVM